MMDDEQQQFEGNQGSDDKHGRDIEQDLLNFLYDETGVSANMQHPSHGLTRSNR